MSTMSNEQIEKIFMTVFDQLPKIDYNPEWVKGWDGDQLFGTVHGRIDRICASASPQGRQIIFVPNYDGDFSIIYFRSVRDPAIFLVHGTRPRYSKERGRFMALPSGPYELSKPEAQFELDMLEHIQTQGV